MNDAGRDISKGLILVVDDNNENLRFLAGILFEQGYAVRTVSNGSRALFSVQAEPPDLILLDIMMPGMSGYEVCEKLKAQEHSRNIPIIFISALHEVQEKVKGFVCGGVDYITKPFQVEEVLARVETHLTLQRLQQQLQENNVQLQSEIAERKRAEEELIRYKDQLEELVEHRTAELKKSNEQLQERNVELQQSKEALQEASEAAEIANQAKGEFIANISHELRTPLNGVLGFAQVLHETHGLTPKQQRAVNMILQSGEHLLMIINDLIDLSNLEAGKIKLQPKEFFLQPFLTGLMKVFRIRAEQQQIAFEQHFVPGLPGKITADERRLRQILLNLLGNAFKFTRQGQVTFKIASLPEQEAQHAMHKLRFQVDDTGVGIPDDQLDNIFAAFHQIGEKRLAQTEGVGLGLTVSQRLARMMNSELHVQSTVGKGSSFWFDLEILESEDQSEPLISEAQDIFREDEFAPEKAPPIVPPSSETLHTLIDLLDMGDIMAIREHAEQLRVQDQRVSAFADKVSHLSETLNINELRTFLQRYVEADQNLEPE